VTADVLTVLAAIVVPIVALLAIVGLITRVHELEHAREDLIELGPAER
jgi:hypothetical protein